MTTKEGAQLEKLETHLEYLIKYGIDFINRTITICEDIDESVFFVVDVALREMERSSRKGIKIIINSFGGSTYDASAIVGRIRSSKCHITTEGYGKVMSASTLILASGSTRLLSQFATVMHHEASYSAEGRHSEMKAIIEQSENEERLWANWMSKFSNRDEEFWYSTGKAIDKYLTPNECLELGIIDRII
jgi:ATP-dependent protease ClpP protease subunit